MRKSIYGLLACGVAAVSFLAAGSTDSARSAAELPIAERQDTAKPAPKLPTIATYEKLRELIEKARERGNLYIGEREGGNVVTYAGGLTGEMPAPAPDSEGRAPSAPGSDDYSRTNVQVEGVDEADWAKTDGRYVYQIGGPRVYVADVSDPRSPKLSATLEFAPEERFEPLELYVDDGRLIVIGQRNVYFPDVLPGSEEDRPAGENPIVPPDLEGSRFAVATKIYEMGSGLPKLVRETILEGRYVSSRKIGEALYVVANKGFYAPSPFESAEDYEPWYGDTGTSSGLNKLTLDRVRYFPDSPDITTMLIGALDLSETNREMQVAAYLGAGQTIYASEKHLYVAIPEYVRSGGRYVDRTKVHKFGLDEGTVSYAGSGSVPGTVLNRYSMDEYDGYFRIATTKDNLTGRGAAQSTNNLYVLDANLKTVGKLEKLAPGERIFSARFLGGRAYLVTFRNVDPLFAIDLREPAKPAVLGQLKIPGYSDYLHPYDENHILGFGKDTAVHSTKIAGTEETIALYQGLKMALFDVSDVTRPKEKFKEIIGDRGTSSEMLTDPKALLFSKADNLLAFPVELLEVPDGAATVDGKRDPSEYGRFVFQGAYVYRLDLEEGFRLRGRISHLSDEDLLKSGDYGYDYSKAVRRILYSGDTLFTLSASQLTASDKSSLAERGKLVYPGASDDETARGAQPPIFSTQPLPIVR